MAGTDERMARMSAREFLLGGGTPKAARPGEPAARADDGAQRLYDELMKALRARGLGTVHHACQHCQKLAAVDLLAYPEVRMAVADAIGAFSQAVAERFGMEAGLAVSGGPGDE